MRIDHGASPCRPHPCSLEHASLVWAYRLAWQAWWEQTESVGADAGPAPLFRDYLRHTPKGGVMRLPMRGDDVENWLRWQRDKWERDADEWGIINDVLDEYRKHADTGTPLTEEVQGG